MSFSQSLSSLNLLYTRAILSWTSISLRFEVSSKYRAKTGCVVAEEVMEELRIVDKRSQRADNTSAACWETKVAARMVARASKICRSCQLTLNSTRRDVQSGFWGHCPQTSLLLPLALQEHREHWQNLERPVPLILAARHTPTFPYGLPQAAFVALGLPNVE